MDLSTITMRPGRGVLGENKQTRCRSSAYQPWERSDFIQNEKAKIIKAEAEIQANSPSSPLMAKAAGFSCSLDFALLSGTVKFPETLEDA